jgi:choice-of-anchor A domain-containing protein
MTLRSLRGAFLLGAVLTAISCGEEPGTPGDPGVEPDPDLANSPPQARCKNVTVTATSTCMLPASINDGSSDPDGDLVGCTQSPAGPYSLGTTTVTLRCTDQGGRSSTCTGTVAVTDGVVPVVNVSPRSQTVQCSRGSSYPYLTGVNASDLCEGMLPPGNISWSGTVNMGQLGSSTVTYQARDASNNMSAPVPRTVTVVDTMPPLLSMLGNASMPQECGMPFNDPGAIATDVCLGPITSSIVRTGTVNTAVPGSYTLRYDVSDGSNAAAPRTRTVIVSDTRRPTVTLVGPLSVTAECNGSFTDPGATATDLCAGTLQAVQTHPPDLSQPGSYSTQYTATDPSGNTSSPSQFRVITVFDTLPPTLTLNGSANMVLECAFPFQDPGATANDQCAGSQPVTTSGTVNPRQLGAQTLTYSASDGNGHTATVTRTVTVRDRLAPVIELLGPASMSLECDGAPYVEPGAVAWDTCAGDLTSELTITSDLDQSQSGEYTVTYTVEDGAGHVRTATRQLTVGECIHCIELRLSEYNLFLLESYNGGHDVEGKVAAGGDITMTNFAVGAGVPGNNLSNTLVAGGNLTLAHGGVWGDVWYGGTYSADEDVTLHRGTLAQGTPIPFAARFAELRDVSSELDALPATGTTTTDGFGNMLTRGTDPSLNVFDMDTRLFASARAWTIDAPAGSLVVINLHGASAAFTGFGIGFIGGIDENGVIYNFVDTTQIQAQNFGFWGTILAPLAHITFINGSWDGGIYARSLTGNGEGHINPVPDRDICE